MIGVIVTIAIMVSFFTGTVFGYAVRKNAENK